MTGLKKSKSKDSSIFSKNLGIIPSLIAFTVVSLVLITVVVVINEESKNETYYHTGLIANNMKVAGDAFKLFEAIKGRYPESIGEMVYEEMLNKVPDLYGTNWDFVITENSLVVRLTNITDDLCSQFQEEEGLKIYDLYEKGSKYIDMAIDKYGSDTITGCNSEAGQNIIFHNISH